MIARLDKVTVYVGSQEDAKAFWINKIGFVVTYEQAMGPGMTWLEVAPAKGQTSLVLYPKKSMEAQNPAMVAHPSVIFGAWDIEKTWTEYKSKGVDLDEIQKMPYGSMFFFRDPDKNRYVVRQIGA